jgi:hypothetical protein
LQSQLLPLVHLVLTGRDLAAGCIETLARLLLDCLGCLLLLQDFLTSAFLLTSKDTFLTRAEICQLIGYMTGAPCPICLPLKTDDQQKRKKQYMQAGVSQAGRRWKRGIARRHVGLPQVPPS